MNIGDNLKAMAQLSVKDRGNIGTGQAGHSNLVNLEYNITSVGEERQLAEVGASRDAAFTL